MSENSQNYENKYSEKGFWEKVANFALVAGKEVIEKALWLYYASQDPQVPIWAKSVIYTALGYFILPLDAIADVVPVVGYADDLGALAAAVAVVAMYITDEVKAKATKKMLEWFTL